MGKCASLFYSTDADAQTLNRRIRPSDEQYDTQKKEWNDLAAVLLKQLKERTELPFESWLQGSYKFGTQIRPSKTGEEFDIDLGLYAVWSGDPEDGELGARELKSIVQELLEDFTEEQGEDRCTIGDPKERCNRIHFGDDFHIDTPCYHLDRGADVRHLATESDNWEASDPKEIYLWWKEAFTEELRPRARRLVQYLKMWAALAFEDGDRPSSVMLTVIVGEALKEIDGDALTGDDEWFAALVDYIVDSVDIRSVENPVDSGENLNRLSNDQNTTIEEALDDLQDISSRALGATDKITAAEIWSEAFQHFFPIPEEEEVLKEGAGALVPMTFDPLVSVVARPKESPQNKFTGQNGIGPIPRDCDIYFSLDNARQLPHGAVVRWTVRNQGEEAENVNDLGHLAGTGFEAKEHSAYRGVHFMDVSIWLRGQVIGRRRIPVTISGVAMPKRNPPRPAYVKLRKRR